MSEPSLEAELKRWHEWYDGQAERPMESLVKAAESELARMECLQQHFEDFYWQSDFPSPEEDLRKAIDKWRKEQK